MSVLIAGMEMPNDCPMCPMSHWDAGDNFRGCEIVPGKKHAIRDPEYANSDHRPNWCPLVPIPEHGRLIDADALEEFIRKDWDKNDHWIAEVVYSRPTIIPAEEVEG